ncbi:LacI family DNA-binding transcriptional regulator [Clostridium uliginosum]|uniref:LacI family transcriptional regulator n=1 Tax=Clostridium uliginosum TaxID=119641 RepID=A0A1I1SR45_9CLOT|nr:LacI family DNA-binding transcriptional regulator [Clostridium uliginosum]SFD47198.1 LacI family transcriptional regulator [Clostridium uliginosum]
MKKVTIMDIAKKVNVSKTTVSMVLNNKEINVSDETRKKIFKSAKEMNYIPNTIARSLSTNKTNTIGIILPDIENPFFAMMAKTIEDTAEKLNYNVILCNSYNNTAKEEKYVKLLISKLVDGVIFAAGGKSEHNLNILTSNKVPFVLVDRYVESINEYSGVFCSNEQGIKLGVDYLYSKNKRKIAFVTGHKDLKIGEIRYNAYKKIAEELGVYDEELIIRDDFTIEGGMNSTKKLLALNKKIDAIFYSSDVMALGGFKVLIREGYRVPKDISILGYDNINISYILEPELTTISQPIYEMGQSACELLVNMINGTTENLTISLNPTLIERDTVS